MPSNSSHSSNFRRKTQQDEHAWEVLECGAVLQHIGGYAQSSRGKALVQSLRPSVTLEGIRRRRPLYADCLALQQTALDLPGMQTEDLSEILLRCAPEGAVLAGEELVSILSQLDVVASLRRFLSQEKAAVYSSLQAFCAPLEECSGLSGALRRCLDKDGSLLDHASETLSNLRRHSAALRNRIQKGLESLLHQEEWRNVIQEQFVTERNGRFVVPVRRDSRDSLPGVVHDLSHSGATLFVEPASTLALGNELSQASGEEREEIRRILARLSGQVRNCRDALLRNQEILTELDAARAVARWAVRNGCELPVFTGTLQLHAASHPLLQIRFQEEPATVSRRVVPMDFCLPEGKQVLAITGANAGGKTVALKTLGQLCLLAQCGLPVPAGGGSTFEIFDHVLADIGDEQSLEENLSTFSSHVTRWREILQVASEGGRCLILLDELGSGTEPSEGGALACALLSAFQNRRALTVATTHLSLVKNFVHSQPRMCNGAVRFNPETLLPEYVLEIGRPGASHALTIARQMGLPASVLGQAEAMLSPNHRKLEEMLAKMEQDQKKLESLTRQAEEESRRAAVLRRELETARNEWNRERDRRLREAHQEADALVGQTRRDLEQWVRQIRETARKQTQTVSPLEPGKLEQIHQALKEKSRMLAEGIRKHQESPSAPVAAETLAPGRRVWIDTLHAHGVVESVSLNRKSVVVQVNGIPFTLDAGKLQMAKDGRQTVSSVAPVVKVSFPVAKGQTPHELNLIGLRVEEALEQLASFMDRAVLARMPEVCIIHGFGTGRLRLAVQQWLARCPAVREFHGEAGNERSRDNSGCTIVQL